MGWIGLKIKSTSSSEDTAETLQLSQDRLPQSSNATSNSIPASLEHSARISDPSWRPSAGRAPQVPAPGRSARCRRRPPPLRGARRLAARLGCPRGAGGLDPWPATPGAPLLSRPAPGGTRPDHPGTPRAGDRGVGAEDEGEGGCPAPPPPSDSLPSAAARSALPVCLTGLQPVQPRAPAFRAPWWSVERQKGRTGAAAAASGSLLRFLPGSLRLPPHPCEWPEGSQLAAGPPPASPAQPMAPPPASRARALLAVEDRAGAVQA